MSSTGARIVAAAAALKPLGLHLLVSPPDQFVITDKPDDITVPARRYSTIEQVEAFIADNRPTPTERQILATHDYVATTYGDPPGTVSSGSSTMTLEYRHPKPIEPRKPQVCEPVHYVSHGSPVREDGTQAYKSVCRAAIVTEVYDIDPAPEDGAPYVCLCVLNPTGQFFSLGVRYDPGTFTGPERTAIPGEPLPLVTCDDLTFDGGTWHWISA